jgi:hypothetical protein
MKQAESKVPTSTDFHPHYTASHLFTGEHALHMLHHYVVQIKYHMLSGTEFYFFVNVEIFTLGNSRISIPHFPE